MLDSVQLTRVWIVTNGQTVLGHQVLAESWLVFLLGLLSSHSLAVTLIITPILSDGFRLAVSSYWIALPSRLVVQFYQLIGKRSAKPASSLLQVQFEVLSVNDFHKVSKITGFHMADKEPRHEPRTSGT